MSQPHYLMPKTARYYLSQAGYIVDSNDSRLVARVKDDLGWRDFSRAICHALNSDMGEAETLTEWADRLEQPDRLAIEDSRRVSF